jgi:hypothetical protein
MSAAQSIEVDRTDGDWHAILLGVGRCRVYQVAVDTETVAPQQRQRRSPRSSAHLKGTVPFRFQEPQEQGFRT